MRLSDEESALAFDKLRLRCRRWNAAFVPHAGHPAGDAGEIEKAGPR